MNRINELFKSKKDILNIYFTAGYPALEDTTRIIKELTESGVDMIEIGMPFSDPLADGPVIQNSSEIAIRNGMTLAKLFEQLIDIRKTTDVPLLLMGYLNPILQYGVEDFCRKSKEVGIDGVILPDLPLRVYRKQYQDIFESTGLKNVQLITPQTAEERIREIDQLDNGFIYIVSSASTTGGQVNTSHQQAYFEKIKLLQLNNPSLIGFGINSSKTYKKACEYSSGAIVGSAFIKHLTNDGSIEEFVESIRKPIAIG